MEEVLEGVDGVEALQTGGEVEQRGGEDVAQQGVGVDQEGLVAGVFLDEVEMVGEEGGVPGGDVGRHDCGGGDETTGGDERG